MKNTNKTDFGSPQYDETTVKDERNEGSKISSSEQDMNKKGKKGGEQILEEQGESGQPSSSEQDVNESGRP